MTSSSPSLLTSGVALTFVALLCTALLRGRRNRKNSRASAEEVCASVSVSERGNDSAQENSHYKIPARAACPHFCSPSTYWHIM